METWLKLVPITDGNRSVMLLETPLTIGRHPENIVQIEGPNVSRHHAVIEYVVTDGVARHRIRDLGSRNGVRLNGENIAESYLNPGDRIGIGRHEYVLEAS